MKIRSFKFVTYLCLIFIYNISFAQNEEFPISYYNLNFSKDNMRLVKVEAEIVVQEPYLEMNLWGIPPEINEGWAKFVNIQSIKDEHGNLVNYQWVNSVKQWHLDVPKNTKLELSYQVRLEHDNYNWDAAGGIDGRPTIWDGESIFWITKGLFLYCYGDDTPKKAEITINVPDNWIISSPWIRIGNQKFLTNDIDELDNNILVVGNQVQRTIKYDEMSITIVTPSNFKHQIDILEQNLKRILPEYKNVFGELPKTNYLVCASKNTIEDGEAYRNSFHQMFLDQDLGYNKMIWANTLAHEMFHYWNGLYFLYSEDHNSNYWFSEGFTDYYSSLALIRAGIVSKEDYLKKLAFQFARFHGSQILQKDVESLVSAGTEKGKNWYLIYGGGSSMAFVLDVEIRDRTNGKKSLDDFMRILYSKYGKQGKPISLKVQLQELNMLTNTKFDSIFDAYISGKKPALNLIKSTCEKAGLAFGQYQLEVYLTPKLEISNSIFESIIKMEE